MTDRERFRATFHYQERDRCPICDFGFWEETLLVWESQGLPRGVNTDEFFGMDPWWNYAPVAHGLFPAFPPETLEEGEDYRIVRDEEGVISKVSKRGTSIPQFLDWTLKDRESWQLFKARLDPTTPGRYPADWQERVASYEPRDYVLGIHCGSFYGWIRNWMGLENLSLLLYDDRGLVEEMVETVATCIIESIRPALESGVRFDYAMIWEDIAFRYGPMISPALFRQIVVPHYRRLTEMLYAHGVDVIMVDCDGKIDELVPCWLDAGVNCMFPLEIGTWQADPYQFRREYGKDCLLMGGVDKHILARDRAAIDAMIRYLTPLVEEGGYIPTPDHRVPPDVPLENYLYYLDRIKEVWGKGVQVRPTGRIRSDATSEFQTR